MSDAKAKEEWIGATKPAHLDEFTIWFDADGSIGFGPEAEEAKVETSYQRAKGPKIVNRVHLPNATYERNLWEFVRKNFDKIFAVDTNSSIFEDQNISVCAVVELRQDFIASERITNCYWSFSSPFCIEIHGAQFKPENLGWYLALNRLEHFGRWKPSDRTALVVDCDLSLLGKYNARTLPIFSNFVLPANVQLHYASGETGRDQPFNKAISVADSLSSQTIKAIKSKTIPALQGKRHQNELFDDWRIVHAER